MSPFTWVDRLEDRLLSSERQRGESYVKRIKDLTFKLPEGTEDPSGIEAFIRVK